MGKDLAIDYRQKTERIQRELQKVKKDFPGIFDNHNKAIGKYLEFVNDPDCQVAIVGAVNAGKSTLMNAILGVDIASTDVRPETAALTIFKYSPKGNYVEVHFYTTEEWNDLWASAAKSKDPLFRKEYDELGAGKKKKDWIDHPLKKETPKSIGDLRATVKEYSSSQSPCHYFVKKLVIGLSTWGSKNFPLPPYLSFVDTPGLFDVIPYRANITKDYIDRANAVVVCVDKTIRDDDYKTIVETFENIGNDKGKVIILGTQIDVLNEPDEDWKKLKEKWHKQFEDLYRDKQLVDTNIIGVSAYIFNMVQKLDAGEPVKDNAININTIITFAEKSGIPIRPYNPLGRVKNIFTDEKKVILKKKNRDEILRQTNIGDFLRVLKEGPLNEPDRVLTDDIHLKFNDILTELKATAEDQKKKVEKKLNYLRADQKKKQGEIADKNRKIKKIRAEKNEFKDKFDTMQKEITDKITTMKKKINKKLKESIGA